ncbi:aldo/keto reductase [Algihabitans albus]|uniref:aldo/keto reductase n=1 Tax=Algihabitans albus TaxID=2164067 RepID=UPI000E5C684F|nr:aldo/keto reductase [Algihabitans albus]
MDYVSLGRTGVEVSQLCFGTMSFGGDADEAEAGRLYAACRDAGVNFFDCADVYSQGRAEEILGRLIARERDQLVITSKCFNPMGEGLNDRGLNRRHISMAVEASLRRLGTDRLDLLFLHKWDPNTPLEETLRALEDLVRAGKVVYVGASNFAAWQIAKALGVSERHGWNRFQVIQPMYSLVKRQAESEILPLVAAEGLGAIVYSPVGGGLLSGKYGSDRKPESGRLLDNRMYATRYGEDWIYRTAADFTAFAGKLGVHPVSLAVAWAGAHPAVTCPIVGARNVEQLQPALNSVEIEMMAELRAEIAALSRQPAPATDRLEEAE